MAEKITRREALVGASSALMLQVGCSRHRITPDSIASNLFQHGVASGDPDDRSIVIWTRVSGVVGTIDVTWQLALDPAFQGIVSSGQIETNASRDHTVKIVADNLQPGTQYYYRFLVGVEESPTGMTLTLPTGSVERLILAVASCSNYPFGYFNAYEAIAKDPEIDCVVHLGDYIYEYDIDGYGAAAGRKLGRQHEPAHETLSLNDYRKRHAQYKSDPGSMLMHGRHPLIAIWDDHESANNPWEHGAQNHQEAEGNWNSRRADSLQAYFEWMPVRDPPSHKARAEYWRHFKWGDLGSLVTLESRHTGRSLQIDYNDHIDNINTPDEAHTFVANVIGSSERNMLSAEMELFLQTELTESLTSGRPWRIIGNQTVMARRLAPKIKTRQFDQFKTSMSDDELALYATLYKYGELDLPNDLDSWSGYPAARERFYDLAKRAGARDLLILAGDSHSFWTNELFDAENEPMGIEIGTGGVTSPGFPFAQKGDVQQHFDALQVARNSEVVWTDATHQGYVRIDIRRNRARTDYVAVSNIESRRYRTDVIRTIEISNDDGRLTLV